jgi:hypothetical protein
MTILTKPGLALVRFGLERAPLHGGLEAIALFNFAWTFYSQSFEAARKIFRRRA